MNAPGEEEGGGERSFLAECHLLVPLPLPRLREWREETCQLGRAQVYLRAPAAGGLVAGAGEMVDMNLCSMGTINRCR